MKDFYQRGDARPPVTKPMHRRCACHEEIPADKWKDHIDFCVVRAKKQDLERARKAQA